MNVAIVGKKNRAGEWEKHLRKLTTVKKVIISSNLPEQKEANAVIILNDSANNLHLLHDSVRLGFHTYLVAKLPADQALLKKIYHSSEEANVNVLFSHWSSISPASQWMAQQYFKPSLIQIKKEILPANINAGYSDFQKHWVNELALILKLIRSNIHRIEAKPILLKSLFTGLQLTLRFEDGSVASLQFSSIGKKRYHQRIFSNQNMVFDFDVEQQRIRSIQLNEQDLLTVREKKFDPADTAERSVAEFIKSIQMGSTTFFSPYDALKTSDAVNQINNLLKKG